MEVGEWSRVAAVGSLKEDTAVIRGRDDAGSEQGGCSELVRCAWILEIF